MCFVPADIDEAIRFLFEFVLGLRLSDRSNIVAFMHAIHGSDHHVLAFAQSTAPGMHHCELGTLPASMIGLGAMSIGRTDTEGLGPSSSCSGIELLHYVQDPWAALRNIPATSTTFRPTSAGRRGITPTSDPSTSGARSTGGFAV